MYTWLLQSGYNLWQLQNFIVDHYSDILLAFDVKINWNATALRKFNILFSLVQLGETAQCVGFLVQHSFLAAQIYSALLDFGTYMVGRQHLKISQLSRHQFKIY